MKKSLFWLLSLSLLPAITTAAPKNIIYMIGDGMGPAYLSAYRYYQDDPATKPVETTVFDQLLVGMASTYPDDDTIVTDSAAGATALATRVKSYNGAIAVNHQHQPLETLLELAKAKGKKTGIVSTSQINHATPASFAAHNKTRKAYNEIADDYLRYQVADLMLGGGTDFFIRPDKNLVQEFQQAGYQYADQWSTLTQLSKLPALALLAPVGLPSALNNPQPNPLATLTDKALSLLSNAEQGFVLMIEGSQIDWCGHANDIACALAEMHDFALAVQQAKAYVDAHPDTLLVITADHETGGLSLGSSGVYAWKKEVIKPIQMTAEELAKLIVNTPAKEIAKIWQQQTSLPLSDAEMATLIQAHQQVLSSLKGQTLKPLTNISDDQRDMLKPLLKAIKDPINFHSKTGWTSTAHTAIDVPVMAWGQQRMDFAGFQDNTDIADKLMRYLK